MFAAQLPGSMNPTVTMKPGPIYLSISKAPSFGECLPNHFPKFMPYYLATIAGLQGNFINFVPFVFMPKRLWIPGLSLPALGGARGDQGPKMTTLTACSCLSFPLQTGIQYFRGRLDTRLSGYDGFFYSLSILK